MAGYKARQIAAIEHAVAVGRRALRREGRYDPLRFGEVFVAEGGIQIPGRPDAVEAAAALGRALIAALSQGRCPTGDRDLQREWERVHRETEWARQAASERVVGFSLQPPPGAAGDPAWQTLLKDNRGYGAGVYGKLDVVVPPPGCEGIRLTPVTVDELEC